MFSLLLLLAGSCFCIACSEEIWKKYGSSYSCNLPRRAEFLEFTPLRSPDHPRILWNRTNRDISGGRGQVVHNVWEMLKLTQADNGYYNFRRKDRTLVSRNKLIVQEYTETYEKMVREDLQIVFALDSALCTLTFIPKSDPKPVVLMKAGRLVGEHVEWTPGSESFSGRIRKLPSHIPKLGVEIDYLKPTDSGSFEVRDQNGNLALVVMLEVLEPVPQSIYIGVAVGIVFMVILCCCCVRKCCCKSSSKRDNSVPQTAAAPAVYHDVTSQPSGPSYSTAPYAPTYPASSSLTPQVTSQPSGPSYSTAPYAPTYPASSSLTPQVAATGGEGAAPSVSLGSDCFSSDHEPQFKMKGLTSAGPLSSDTTFCDVYTSDKLNFF